MNTLNITIPVPNTVYASFFYTFVELGVFSFGIDKMLKGAGGKGNWTVIDDSNLYSPKDLKIIDGLRKILFNFPTPSLVNNQVVMDQIFQTNVQESLHQMNLLVPGSAQLLLKIIEENRAYMYFSWSDDVIIQMHKDDGWRFVSKDPVYGSGGDLIIAYTFNFIR